MQPGPCHPQTLVSLFLLLLIATVTSAHCPEDRYAAEDQQAQQALDSALQALGGLERLRTLNSLFFKGKGSEFRSADLQGPDPSTPIKASHEETTAAFPSQERILYEHRTGRHDGSFRWRRWMYSGEERTVIDMQDDLISQARRDPAAATERARIARTPHLLLLEAVNQKANLRWRYTVVPDKLSRQPGPTRIERRSCSKAIFSITAEWHCFQRKIHRAIAS